MLFTEKKRGRQADIQCVFGGIVCEPVSRPIFARHILNGSEQIELCAYGGCDLLCHGALTPELSGGAAVRLDEWLGCSALRYNLDRKISDVFWNIGCASVLKHELIVLNECEIATNYFAHLAKNHRMAKNRACLGQQMMANG